MQKFGLLLSVIGLPLTIAMAMLTFLTQSSRGDVLVIAAGAMFVGGCVLLGAGSIINALQPPQTESNRLGPDRPV